MKSAETNQPSAQKGIHLQVIPGAEVLRSYEYKDDSNGLQLHTEMVGPNDFRLDAAKEVEVQVMVALGDPEDEVRAEFPPYNSSSKFFLVYENGESELPEDMLGMGRILVNATEKGSASNKTLNDLAYISDWQSDESSVGNISQVVKRFKAEAGVEDMDKVWDIATLAPAFAKLQERNISAGKFANALINGFLTEVKEAYERGELTHCTAFVAAPAYEAFTDRGFPFRPMFDLEPVLYDNNDTGEGMIAQPAWLSVKELLDAVEAENTRYFRQYGQVATQSSVNVPIAS